MPREHHLTVERTARYYTLGDPRSAPRELWIACHGYAQLAGRFLRALEPLDDGTRLIVAPEGLSRFYLESPGVPHAQSPVGASWMTREDRLAEIDDYLVYLDALHEQVRHEMRPEPLRTVAFGFSQGAATVSRWAARGDPCVDRLILWGSLLPHDLDLAACAGVLRAMEIVAVVGDADAHLPPAALAEQLDRLAAAGIPARLIHYPGGHRIEPEPLLEAAEDQGSGVRGQEAGPRPTSPES
jgi:predicted esterase